MLDQGSLTAERLVPRSNQVGWNVAANFAGKGCQALLSLAFLPIYVRLLGMEAFGLLGVQAALSGSLGFLDLGLSTTLNRELARLSSQPGKEQEAQDTVRTLGRVYWAVGILLGIGIISLSPLVAAYWVNAQQLSPSVVRRAVVLMGLGFGFQWPLSFYTGGLMGLQRQVRLNAIAVAIGTLRYAGCVPLLFLFPRIECYLLWQTLLSGIHTAVLARTLDKSLPRSALRAHFNGSILRKAASFASQVTILSVVSIPLVQLDKIVLSKMVSLEAFGYYSLAVTVAATLNWFASAVYAATFPRLCQLWALREENGLARVYQRGAQLAAITTLPAAILLVTFSGPLLLLWTGSPGVAKHAGALVTFLGVGYALNSLMAMPLGLQLSTGWVRLSIVKNVVALAILVPLLIGLIKEYGAAGAAYAWIILNGSYVLIEVPIMHRRLLRDQMWRWYAFGLVLPLAAGVVPCVLLAGYVRSSTSTGAVALWIAVIAGLVFAASASVVPLSWMTLRGLWRRYGDRIQWQRTR